MVYRAGATACACNNRRLRCSKKPLIPLDIVILRPISYLSLYVMDHTFFLPMEFTKTGTTIVGLKYRTGVVLCADTRSTSGPVVADKNCKKIHYISDKIMCCGAGTAADTDRVTRRTSKELELFRLRFGREPYVTHAVRHMVDYLHGYKGQIGAALVLGGIDSNGVHLFSISPHGYSNSDLFTSLGSGSLAAIAELEARYREGMSVDEAVELGVSAVKKGILNDLYSGSNVDVCIIDHEGVQYLRNYVVVESKKSRAEIKYPPSSIKVISEEATEIPKANILRSE